ncbi:L,D-transpeptidase family protein [Neobacillus muris]|uniref:L,D-transpeptidase family protein n=1 Tax=Neobacillus muris TaxID=2941334 RepID=UPI00203A5BC7|nr:L,D-transpeptidase family protein [Neobacillus muris]
METAVNQAMEELSRKRTKTSKRPVNWKLVSAIIIVIALIIGGISYYQATHFNSNIKINGTNVGGLTSDKALKKLTSTVLKNTVYVGGQQIIDGKDMKMSFTEKDLPSVKELLKKQWTFFPSSKEKNYSIMPSNLDDYRSQTLKKQVEEKLLSLNQNLTAPQDALAYLEEGEIKVSPAINGDQYDVGRLLKEYEKQEYTSEIHLKPVYIQPIKEDSDIVQNEQKKLEELLKQTVEYKVQDKVHTLSASELIKNATVTQDLKVTIDSADIKKKIAEINEAQSTLNKNFNFKTHSGAVVSVKGQGYGWALDEEKETAQVLKAFENGEKSLAASSIIGNGWKGEGFGYDTTANNGIGDTYAEVSLSEQRIWIYKNGQLVVTSNVVTGKHSTGNDTSKGVWYILYKRSPSTLTGRELGGQPSYEVKVDYWAPFTNDGQGFHDASWRKNWSSNAYLTDGSHGCVNTPPSVMKTVYENLSTYEPVVIY